MSLNVEPPTPPTWLMTDAGKAHIVWVKSCAGRRGNKVWLYKLDDGITVTSQHPLWEGADVRDAREGGFRGQQCG